MNTKTLFPFLRTLYLVLLFLSPAPLLAQSKPYVNPQGSFFLGAEMGANQIRSFHTGPKLYLQGGVMAEYYMAKQLSFMVRLKYFQTGASYFEPATSSGGLFVGGREQESGNFRGSNIALPLNIKWEFRVYRDLRANIKLGYAYNFETQSEYTNYSPDSIVNYPSRYSSLNAGLGFVYFFSNKLAAFSELEYFIGGEKGYYSTLAFGYVVNNQNALLNCGIKYNPWAKE